MDLLNKSINNNDLQQVKVLLPTIPDLNIADDNMFLMPLYKIIRH